MTLEELKELIAADRDGIAGIAAGYLRSAWLEHLAPELIAVAEAARRVGDNDGSPEWWDAMERMEHALAALDAKMEQG